MSEQQRLALPTLGGTTTSGDSFDRELAPILWQRTRLIFLAGAIASTVVFALNRIYGMAPLTEAMRPWQLPVHLFFPVSWLAGLLLVHTGERTLEKVQGLAFLIVALNLLLIIPVIATFYPGREAFLPVALMLFVTAALLPCRHAQAWLAGAAVVMSLLAQFVLPSLVPAVGEWWTTTFTPREAFFEHLWRLSGVTLIAGFSVLVSRNLYRLQRTAHKAERLGNYLIQRELGAGGMGKVFVAQHALICRPTAVKVLTAPEGDGRTNLARFEREVQLSASLTHPNTITIFDFGRTADDTFYYAMEYLEGMDLQRLVEQFGPLPPERVVYLLRQALGSLGEAHGRGIVHRDVKPSNLFLTQRGGLYDFVKVLDFGLARRVKGAGDTGLTKTGMVFGTPRYIAPESVYGAQKSDARSDLYNLGGVAYWMLTGKHLFAGSSSLDLIIDHVKTLPEPPSRVTDQPIPPELDRIVMKCLEKEPDDRFQTAEELLEALQTVRFEQPWSQARARQWWELHAPDMRAAVAPAVPSEEEAPRKLDVAATA